MAEAATLADTLWLASRRLEKAGIENARLDARLIVEHVTGTTRLDAIARPEQMIARPDVEAIEKALERRTNREPVHRILGAREFYGLNMTLSAETLEPRPDTEILVDAVLPFAKDRAGNSGCRILDLGTGTGAILITLLVEIPGATGLAVDILADALETAKHNADLHAIADRLEMMVSDWFENVVGSFDLIVSNPPYIATNDIADLDREVREFDPHMALDGGADGLAGYRAIAKGAHAHLAQGGRIGVEIGSDQMQAVVALFQARGFGLIDSRKDLGGNDRVLIFGSHDCRGNL